MKYLKLTIIAALFLVLVVNACALLQIGQPQYKIFELTIGGQKVVINLPKEFPSMDEAINVGEMCWDAKLCAQGFCLNDEARHGHAQFFYSGKKVVALGWCPTAIKKECRQWLFAKGKFIEVDSAKFTKGLDSIRRKAPKSEDDSV